MSAGLFLARQFARRDQLLKFIGTFVVHSGEPREGLALCLVRRESADETAFFGLSAQAFYPVLSVFHGRAYADGGLSAASAGTTSIETTRAKMIIPAVQNNIWSKGGKA